MRRASTRVLMYHGLLDGPGVPRGRSRRSYALSMETFSSHVRTLDSRLSSEPSLLTGLAPSCSEEPIWALTFDDGLESVLPAADLLESVGWRAHIFIVTSWIGKDGFLTPAHIVDLHNRGHVIGSHSLTHPDPMSALPFERLHDEWRRSLEDLSALVGAPVTVGAVPGGGYSTDVAAAAARAGMRVLFTSEPVTRGSQVDGCEIVGRFAVRSSTSSREIVALANGDRIACGRQWVGWNTKKLVKRAMGDAFYRSRAHVLRLRNRETGREG